jgi:hypothetical protein
MVVFLHILRTKTAKKIVFLILGQIVKYLEVLDIDFAVPVGV